MSKPSRSAELTDVVIEPALEPRAALLGTVANHPPGGRLPPELLLHVMEMIECFSQPGKWHCRVWKTALLAMLRVSRAWYALGLSVLLRELEFKDEDNDVSLAMVAKWSTILEDGLGVDKFSFARILLFPPLPFPSEEWPPNDDWEGSDDLKALKRLHFHTTCFERSYLRSDLGARPYRRLFNLAEDMEHLEEFHLDCRGTYLQNRLTQLDVWTWPQELCYMPNLTKKLTECTVIDRHVRQWAALAPPNVKRVHLVCNSQDPLQWKVIDPFPNLEDLTVCKLRTSHLVSFPFRNVKRLDIESAKLDLDIADQPALRKRIEDHGLQLTIQIYEPLLKREPHLARAWKAEMEFWKTVAGVTVIGTVEN